METRFKWILLLVISLPLFFSSCKENKKKEVATVAPPVKVNVIEITNGSRLTGREYSGTVSAENSTTVSFPVTGTISYLYVKEGDKVRKGQVLGKVKSGDYENAYNIAQAQLAEAQDGYDRLKKLHDANALPDVKWVEIQQKLKEAQNMEEMAKRTLNDAVLHSPVTGTVTKKYADVGQNVMPVEPIYEIVSTDELTMDISVGENEIGNFEKGQPAHISFQASNIPSIEGKVSQKSVVADPLTRSYTIKVSLPHADPKVLPGMLGTVTFDSQETTGREVNDGYTLPSGSVLLSHDNKWFVWVVKDSLAERRYVEVDELVANGILVKEGLQNGDVVIVEGMQKVGTGSKVRY